MNLWREKEDSDSDITSVLQDSVLALSVSDTLLGGRLTSSQFLFWKLDTPTTSYTTLLGGHLTNSESFLNWTPPPSRNVNTIGQYTFIALN